MSVVRGDAVTGRESLQDGGVYRFLKNVILLKREKEKRGAAALVTLSVAING